LIIFSNSILLNWFLARLRIFRGFICDSPNEKLRKSHNNNTFNIYRNDNKKHEFMKFILITHTHICKHNTQHTTTDTHTHEYTHSSQGCSEKSQCLRTSSRRHVLLLNSTTGFFHRVESACEHNDCPNGIDEEIHWNLGSPHVASALLKFSSLIIKGRESERG